MKNWAQSIEKLRRWLDAFVALPTRLRIPASVVLALIAHLLFFFVMWLAPKVADWLHLAVLFPDTTPPPAQVAPTPKPKPLELALAVSRIPEAPKKKDDPAAPAPLEEPMTVAQQAQLEQMFQALPEEVKQEYIDVEGLAKRKNLSTRALFESWRDSVAGSRQPGKDSPLPSQDGRTDIPFAGFKNQQANITSPKDFEESDGNRGNSTPSPATPPPPPEPSTIFKPKPLQKNDATPAVRPTAPAVASTPAPPSPPPQAASAPRRLSEGDPNSEAERRRLQPERQLVVLGDKDVPLFVLGVTARRTPPTLLVPPEPTPPEPKPTPPPAKPTPPPTVAQATPKPTPPPMKVAKLSPTPPPPAPKPSAPKSPNYASHMEMKKTEGGGPLGEGGVDAVATERGKYKKMMKMMVESRWLPAVRSRGDLIQTGTVAIRFAIDSKGRLIKFKVDFNTSNNAHAMLVEESIRATKFDPPPPETLRSGVFEDEFSFTVY